MLAVEVAEACGCGYLVGWCRWASLWKSRTLSLGRDVACKVRQNVLKHKSGHKLQTRCGQFIEQSRLACLSKVGQQKYSR